ncbi:MAG: lipoyl(octanoyl) transferase LipB [Actinobacteria bacterium]|nr:MAG: lipoyl(octanoyl) transferase LipB [Actinomycetota bacterium]
MPVPAWLIRPGTVPYDVANAAMHRLAERRLADEIPDTIILLEHPPVFTAVEARGGLVRMIDRGGSFTYHGPGQLVGYPILGLGSRPDAVDYLRRLEEAVIRICANVGVASERRADVQTGVWVGDDKICAIGVRLMRARVTLHGFALNCETDLSWFRGIVACGLPEHGQTSLSDQLGRRVSVADVLPLAERHLSEVFDLSFQPAPGEFVSPLQVADAV